MTGLVFYTVAIPTVVVSNIIYWIDFGDFYKHIFSAIKHLKGDIEADDSVIFWLFDIKNQPLRKDIDEQIKISYQMTAEDNGWRMHFMVFSQLFPAFYILLELFMNKLKIKSSSWKIHFIFNLMYLFVSFILDDVLLGEPVYIENLNWSCKYDYSYEIQDNEHTKVIETIHK